jgi:hypothetical protein
MMIMMLRVPTEDKISQTQLRHPVLALGFVG